MRWSPLLLLCACSAAEDPSPEPLPTYGYREVIEASTPYTDAGNPSRSTYRRPEPLWLPDYIPDPPP